MKALKSVCLSAVILATATPGLSDAAMHDYKANLYDADYATDIAAHGYVVGAAVYGQYDADYDAHLTDADLFQPVLGHHDADYEAHIDRAAFAPTTLASR